MNQNELPLCLSKGYYQEVVPLADMVEVFAEDLVNDHRAGWDLQTPDVPQIPSGGREWYLRRESGLRAFARYAAELRLKHFASDQDVITGAEFCEARLQGIIFSRGWREAIKALNSNPSWKKFIAWRKKTTPAFAQKLHLWCSRSYDGELARHSPDPRIKLYALLFDRCPVPLEFCTEDYSAFILNETIQREDWPGKKVTPNRESVRRWRRDLGLKLSKQVVFKYVNHFPKFDFTAAKIIGLPFGSTQ